MLCICTVGRNPGIKIYAAEPKEADDCARSFAVSSYSMQGTPHAHYAAHGLLVTFVAASLTSKNTRLHTCPTPVLLSCTPQAKTRIPLDGPPSTIADGLKTSLGTYTWHVREKKKNEMK